uniref:Protein WEAK CHLOROPLAST MOVEMENT UNDER BLUE LIGHT 1 n=1 Tax=Rhizophora mucronata TaxID=61149 RepID=A0A2P2NJW5_RHIMU
MLSFTSSSSFLAEAIVAWILVWFFLSCPSCSAFLVPSSTVSSFNLDSI